MTDYPPTTVLQSAMRGLACKCPRCGQGKMYAGFLTLAPACDHCGLDYAFIRPLRERMDAERVIPLIESVGS